MKASKTGQKPIAGIEIYGSFMRLDPERRRRIAMRILRNQEMLGDLYDHFLIQRSMAEPGHNLAWESYARENASGR